MNHSEHSAHGGHPTPDISSQPAFSASDWETFQAEDRQAARNIVGLMTGIFILGVFGYLVVAYVVAESPNYF
jgi:hypothetical protein